MFLQLFIQTRVGLINYKGDQEIINCEYNVSKQISELGKFPWCGKTTFAGWASLI